MFHFKLCFNNNLIRLAMKYSVDLTIFIVFEYYNDSQCLQLLQFFNF